jgi:hypothetical protein
MPLLPLWAFMAGYRAKFTFTSAIKHNHVFIHYLPHFSSPSQKFICTGISSETDSMWFAWMAECGTVWILHAQMHDTSGRSWSLWTLFFQYLTVCVLLHQCHRKAKAAQGFPHSVSLNMFTGIWCDSLDGRSAHHKFSSFSEQNK